MRRIFNSFVTLVALSLAFVLASCQSSTAPSSADQPRTDKILQHLHNPNSDYVIIISHRGDWRNFPENSIPAIESAIEMGADMVEIDIAMTKDSILVLSHDRTIDRCTMGKGRVIDYTFEELQAFLLKTAHDTRCSLNLTIPSLREALLCCKDRILVNIDKGYDYYDQVLALTEELGVTHQVLIKGGKPASEVAAKLASHQNNMLYMPIITPANKAHQPMFEEYIAGEPQLAYEICWSEMTPEVLTAMERVKASGSKLWVNTLWSTLCGGLCDDVAWTTSAEEVYGKILDLGATMVQTDRPEFWIEFLRERGLHD